MLLRRKKEYNATHRRSRRMFHRVRMFHHLGFLEKCRVQLLKRTRHSLPPQLHGVRKICLLKVVDNRPEVQATMVELTVLAIWKPYQRTARANQANHKSKKRGRLISEIEMSLKRHS